ncbi:cupin domain-containing protein [Mycobacterium sp. THU-M104]|uniref:cupin domain-containing protein n=1 Tax=Mycobacterium sp. THU-M104 TaxID=3410515 RepID=UPI003B9C4C99
MQTTSPDIVTEFRGGFTVEPSLAWLLSPLPVQTFLDDIWGATRYHVKRECPAYFDGLLPGPSLVDGLLEHLREEPSVLRLVKGEQDRDPGTYRRADGSLDAAGVRDGHAAGYTIVVDNLERYVRTIGSLAHAIEVQLNFPTQVNGYVTPPESQGFVPHYDHHDVLILQVQGSKVWHLYGDATVPPHEMQRRKVVTGADLPAPTDLRMEAGDTLYLPRGQIHAAETGSQTSVHVTVGIHAPTVLTLITHALHVLSFSDDRIHDRLPPRHLDDGDVRANLGALVRDILEGPDFIPEGLGAMEDVLVRRGRCPPVGQGATAVGIGGNTLVAKHQPLYSRVVTGTGGVALQFAQLLISVGTDHEAALRYLAHSTGPFRVRDLPGLTPAQQTELVRTLIVTGFLVRQPDD